MYALEDQTGARGADMNVAIRSAHIHHCFAYRFSVRLLVRVRSATSSSFFHSFFSGFLSALFGVDTSLYFSLVDTLYSDIWLFMNILSFLVAVCQR